MPEFAKLSMAALLMFGIRAADAAQAPPSASMPMPTMMRRCAAIRQQQRQARPMPAAMKTMIPACDRMDQSMKMGMQPPAATLDR